MKKQPVVFFGKALAMPAQRWCALLSVFFFLFMPVSGSWAGETEGGKALSAADRALVTQLPLVELPAVNAQNDILAIILSGDGGWADLDKTFGEAFQKRGISTVGFDCLKYFWKTRKPAEVSEALDTVVRFYLQTWKKKRVLLVGYSFGADWLPFLVNRLSADILPQVHLCVLLGPSSFVNVEVHVMDWMRDERRAGALVVLPEALRMTLPVLCVSGSEEKDSICALLTGDNVKKLPMPGGHHFHHEYQPVIDTVFKTMEEVEADKKGGNPGGNAQAQ